MRRRLFTLAGTASLVLCLVMAAWWVRSYWISETIGRVGGSKVIVVTSGGGTLVLSVNKADPENEDPGPRPFYFWSQTAASRSPGGLVVEGKRVRFWARVRMAGFGWLVLPHWVLVLITLPGAWLSLVRMWRSVLARVRRNYGHCPACGYDLRATPERCPECGVVSEIRPSAAA